MNNVETGEKPQKIASDRRTKAADNNAGGSGISQQSVDGVFTAVDRHHLISMGAYFLSRQRGGGPGHDVEDWLMAEQEVNAACGLREPSPRWDLKDSR